MFEDMDIFTQMLLQKKLKSSATFGTLEEDLKSIKIYDSNLGMARELDYSEKREREERRKAFQTMFKY